MSIETTQDRDKNLTMHIVTGPVSEDEMYKALEGDADCEPTALILWDMVLADVTHVTADILQRFVQKAAELIWQFSGVLLKNTR